MMRRRGVRIIGMAAVAVAVYAASEEANSCQRKFDEIAGEQLRPGTRVVFSLRELNAWAAANVPPGVRDTRIAIPSAGIAVGSAMIDFARLEQGQGRQPGWIMQKLLSGERPVSVTARIRSGGGEATVDVQRVEVSGLQIDGSTLQFLIDNILLSMYPDAAVGRPFELSHRMERLDVQPSGVTVAIGK